MVGEDTNLGGSSFGEIFITLFSLVLSTDALAGVFTSLSLQVLVGKDSNLGGREVRLPT